MQFDTAESGPIILPMQDRHLNLFYAYGGKDNHGNEKDTLVEDNLTRAFVMTIRLLSREHRHKLLHQLLSRDPELAPCRFESAAVALQNNIPDRYHPKDRGPGDRYEVMRIVTVATSTLYPGMGGSSKEKLNPDSGRPDAWIFDRDGSAYCLLLECKSRSYPVDPAQIRRHAKLFGEVGKSWEKCQLSWSQMQGPKGRTSGLCLLTLTWYDVLRAIREVFADAFETSSSSESMKEKLNKQEKLALTHLKVLLGYYGYWLFGGFALTDNWPAHIIELPTGRNMVR
jgi:hypothetical protein